MTAPLTLSIVSHDQLPLVLPLLRDLALCGQIDKVILTHNLPQPSLTDLGHLGLVIAHIQNDTPQGFGANHNQAFKHCDTEYFAVLNPDLRLPQDPFPALMSDASARPFGIMAPIVENSLGQVEDSARRFPTMAGLALKALGLSQGQVIAPVGKCLAVDWVAGMFMIFPTEVFARLGGFDERYFLYYEDADICTRAWAAGLPVLLNPHARVIHDAQRSSHRNLRYLNWHLSSMARYLWRYTGRLPRS